MLAGRSSSLSAQVVAEVREALFAKRLRPGDFLGTEKDLAARFDASRIVARDALRTLEALGIVEIRMGKGGGASIAHGNPRLFAEALAVQLDLTGVSVAEIMDAQRAIETLGAELAAENATAQDIQKLRRLLHEAEVAMGDLDEFTRLSRDFHLAVTEASHNRVILVQLISLEHVSWPRRNVTATPKLAQHILEIHTKFTDLIELRDPRGARLDGRSRQDDPRSSCCRGRFLAPQRPDSRLLKGRKTMAKFIIEPHFRLHEWVAEEKGYFRDEGLDYEFRELVRATGGKIHDKGDKVGAFQSFEEGRKSNVSCACHWTVNVAASKGIGRMYTDVYSISPAAIFVPADSPVKSPADLAGVPISVGYQSGSHYATVQGLEPYLKPDQIQRNFADGMLFKRMEELIEGRAPAVSLFSGPYYFVEQLGFRKIIDTTFMIATMIHGNPDPEDLRKFFRALRRAQRDIDLRPELYTHYYKNEFPDRFHALMDTRRWGPGERLVFEPYTKEVYEQSFEWIAAHGMFADSGMGSGDYEKATLSLNV